MRGFSSSRTWVLVPVLILVVAGLACGSSGGSATTAAPAGNVEGGPTDIPKAERLKTSDLDEFEEWLADAAAARDKETMASLMRDPFEIRVFAAGGSLRAPLIAIDQIEELFFPPQEFTITCDASTPPEELVSVLGMDPRDFYEGADGFLFCTGWGKEGAGEALLSIKFDDEGSVYWTSITVALNGFSKSSR